MKAWRGRIVALALGALALWPAVAGAVDTSGEYDVQACPLDGWTATRSGSLVAGTSAQRTYDRCASGTAFGIDFTGAMGSLADAWTFTAPPGTSVSGYHLDLVGAGPGPTIAYLMLGTRSSDTLEAPQETGGANLDSPWLALELACDQCDGSERSVIVRQADITLRDASAPEIAGAPIGALPSGGSRAGIVDVSVPFRDAGSGVSTARLLVDGTLREPTRLGDAACVPPYVHAVPCPTAGTAKLYLDTRELTDGPHSASLLLTDAAGNSTTAGPFAFTAANAPPAAASPALLAPDGRLAAGFGKARRARLTAAYAAPPLVTGVAAGLDGAPLSGARVQWSVRSATPGASFTAQPSLVADATGRFSIRLPRGPSRTIRLTYGTSTVTLQLVVRAPVRLAVDKRATRNGRTIHFAGRIPGAPAAAGTRVELQAWADGAWIPFKTAPLKHGRFSASYRFTRTFSVNRYRFRAVVHKDPALPYAAGTSNVVKVLVRP